MRGLLPLALAFGLALSAGAAAWHDGGCVLQQADPATMNVVRTLDGRVFYVEERNVPPPLGIVPVPGSGFLLAEGTWVYEEANWLAGLQRGDSCDFGGCCLPNDEFCYIISSDPITDENCGHGPDGQIFP